jgi:hypothetical protein
VTEILYTPGVELVAPLPPRFELATVYTVAVSARAAHADHGRAAATPREGRRTGGCGRDHLARRREQLRRVELLLEIAHPLHVPHQVGRLRLRLPR